VTTSAPSPDPSSVETVAARDGTPLLTREWPTPGEPWGTILVVHGLGEHSGRHDATGGRFAAAGLAAASYDHRGFGASGGRRAYAETWDDLLDDVEDRLDAGRIDGLPAAIYAHSVGGLVVADYLLSDRPQPDVAVLSAPALDGGTAFLRALAAVLSRVRPTFVIGNPWDADKIARHPWPPVVADPDPLSVSHTTGRLGHLLFRAMDRVNARLKADGGFPLPTLVVHGGDDRLVPTASTASLERFPTTERRVYPGVRHEPHHDPLDGARIVDEMIDWLRERMDGPAPG
jgi:alpha-beta hydrolase superfamily lysophospholipase